MTKGNEMKPDTQAAYEAWRRAAEKGYGNRPIDTPTRMAQVDARIRRLKVKYEQLLARDKGKEWFVE